MKYLFIFIIVCNIYFTNGWSDNKVRKFPPEFMFGAASSAYQVEGAWNEDGKGPSIWDTYLHKHPEVIADGVNGDEASDSYHQYKRDVEMLRELGVDFYRFSISWSRVLPTGFTNNVNKKGLEYYNNLIDELLKHNIKPVITLYHFDLPQTLQELGGWANPFSVQWFENYAKMMFREFGDRVKYWITMNQPNSICIEGYGDNIMAPAVNAKGIADYMCIKNVLLAHAKAYRLYEKEFRKKFKGSVGISLSLNWFDPLDNKNDDDKKAAERARAFYIGMYMDPIWSEKGGFPSMVKDIIAENSKAQGFPKSRLPELTKDEIKLLKGASDFLGVNHYTTFLATPTTADKTPSFHNDLSVSLSQGDKWQKSASYWLKSAPYGLYRVLIHINLEYSYPKMLITEHGFSTLAVKYDNSRVENLRQYLKSVLLALEDGTQLLGYTAWSLMDNVEWIAGTSERFGLYQVDFADKNKSRSARLSALIYKRIIQNRLVEEDYKPDSLDIGIHHNNVKTEL